MFVLLSSFSLLPSRFWLKPSETSCPVVTKTTAGFVATEVEAGVQGVAPLEAGLSPTDAPSAGD